MLYTVGHSVRAESEFLDLLRCYSIQQLIDIRTVPRSRRNPQFDSKDLERSLRGAGIGYRHLPELGGLRKPASESKNTAWKNPGFRGYADYMSTPEFEKGIDRLKGLVSGLISALMCAEADFRKCHRMLLSDALLAQNMEVHHILNDKQVDPHVLTAFANIEGGKITYTTEQHLLKF